MRERRRKEREGERRVRERRREERALDENMCVLLNVVSFIVYCAFSFGSGYNIPHNLTTHIIT